MPAWIKKFFRAPPSEESFCFQVFFVCKSFCWRRSRLNCPRHRLVFSPYLDLAFEFSDTIPATCLARPRDRLSLSWSPSLFGTFGHDKRSLWSDTFLSLWLLPYWAQLTASVRRSNGASSDFSVYSRFTTKCCSLESVAPTLSSPYTTRRGLQWIEDTPSVSDISPWTRLNLRFCCN